MVCIIWGKEDGHFVDGYILTWQDFLAYFSNWILGYETETSGSNFAVDAIALLSPSYSVCEFTYIDICISLPHKLKLLCEFLISLTSPKINFSVYELGVVICISSWQINVSGAIFSFVSLVP